MSVQKVDFQKVIKEKNTYTIAPNSVIQKIKDPIAGFLWIYLLSLPNDIRNEITNQQLIDHLKITPRKFKNALNHLTNLGIL